METAKQSSGAAIRTAVRPVLSSRLTASGAASRGMIFQATGYGGHFHRPSVIVRTASSSRIERYGLPSLKVYIVRRDVAKRFGSLACDQR